MKDVVIVSGVRLPVGSYGGSLKDITALFSKNSENLEFIVCFGLYGNILLRIY